MKEQESLKDWINEKAERNRVLWIIGGGTAGALTGLFGAGLAGALLGHVVKKSSLFPSKNLNVESGMLLLGALKWRAIEKIFTGAALATATMMAIVKAVKGDFIEGVNNSKTIDKLDEWRCSLVSKADEDETSGWANMDDGGKERIYELMGRALNADGGVPFETASHLMEAWLDLGHPLDWRPTDNLPTVEKVMSLMMRRVNDEEVGLSISQLLESQEKLASAQDKEEMARALLDKGKRKKGYGA